MPGVWIKEEPTDKYVYRPLAQAFVRMVQSTPITPNQVSVIACFFGVAGGTAIGWGTPLTFVIAAACLFVQLGLDCADGELARKRGISGKSGQVVDGCSDYIVAMAIHVGLLVVGLELHIYSFLPWWGMVLVVGASGFSMALHSAIFDSTKQRFRIEQGGAAVWMESPDDLQKELDEAKSFSDRFVIRLYGAYAATQRRFAQLAKPEGELSQSLFLGWTFLGPSLRLTLLASALVASIWNPWALVVYPIAGVLLGNVWMGALMVAGRVSSPRPVGEDRKESDPPSPSPPESQSRSKVSPPLQ